MGVVGKKFERRTKAFWSQQALSRAAVRSELRKSLIRATDKTLYDVTPLPVTGRLRRSIFTRTVGELIQVGYSAGIAPYNNIRLNKTGRSKLGGHDMTMRPAIVMITDDGGKIWAIARGKFRILFR